MIFKIKECKKNGVFLLSLVGIAYLIITSQPLSASTDKSPKLYINPQSTTLTVAEKYGGATKEDVLILSKFSSATWFTQDIPDVVRSKVALLVDGAAKAGEIPVLVAYNIPFRDCALYSAGGASDTDAYISWIRAFASGIGDRKAIVALEPDGLGVIPWYKNINGDVESCQPKNTIAVHVSDDRFEQLRKAVDILTELPNTSVYLDGTGSSWLSPGDAAHRLISANVGKAAGFFLNVSNYESTNRVTKYAHWVSDCIALVTKSQFDVKSCASQHYPAKSDDFATWGLTDKAYDKAFADNGLVRDPVNQKHAVIDTSRNGMGSWVPPKGKYKDAEVWCNPPGRGIGMRPTLETDDPYVDGYLWIKIPGESDGECYRGTTGPLDPERKMQDPGAGHWFPEQAQELISNAVPPLKVE